MGNTGLTSRENKKAQLKRQVVTGGLSDWQAEEEESREIVHNAHKRTVRRRIVIVLVILMVLGGIGFAFYNYDRYHQFSEYQVLWEKSLVAENEEAAMNGEGVFCSYTDFGSGVLKATKDGATYYNAQGKAIWVQSYEMKSPSVSVNGDYAVIADQQGNSIYICDESGCQGQATTLLPILRAVVSAKGVVAALQEDSRASYIYFYKKDGSALDIWIKSILSSDGYPIDLSLSPSGTQLITSYVYLDQGLLKDKIVFYNFGLGKDDPKRMVGGFEPQDLAEAMAGRVRFLDDSHAVIFTDKGLQFFSTRVETSPESTRQILLEENIYSISYNSSYVGVITGNTQGSDPYRLRIYDASGSEVFEVSFNYQYTGFDIDGKLVLLYNDTSCMVYNMAGTLKYSGSFDFVLSKVSAGRLPGTLLLLGTQYIEEIRLE